MISSAFFQSTQKCRDGSSRLRCVDRATSLASSASIPADADPEVKVMHISHRVRLAEGYLLVVPAVGHLVVVVAENIKSVF